jgi:hypothetical protein
MKKNVAGQKIGAQMVNASTGAAFTGAVTVYVTGDDGTQAIGSVGSGACTHKGNGLHNYSPAQAETNYDHVEFTFIGTGAIPATVQVYPTFPQTGDNFARLGAPAGASHAADVAAVKAETALIVADTNELQTDWVNGGRLDVILDARASQTSVDDVPTNAELAARTLAAADYATAANLATVDTVADAIQAKTDNLPSDPADQSLIIAATNAILADTNAIKPKTDNLPASPAATGDIPSAASIVTALHTAAIAEGYAADGAEFTFAQALYMIWSLLHDRSISGTTLTSGKLDKSPAMTFTLDSATTPTAQERAT